MRKKPIFKHVVTLRPDQRPLVVELAAEFSGTSRDVRCINDLLIYTFAFHKKADRDGFAKKWRSLCEA